MPTFFHYLESHPTQLFLSAYPNSVFRAWLKHHLLSVQLNQEHLFSSALSIPFFLIVLTSLYWIDLRIPDRLSCIHLCIWSTRMGPGLGLVQLYLHMEKSMKEHEGGREWMNEEGYLRCIHLSGRTLLWAQREHMRKGYCFAPDCLVHWTYGAFLVQLLYLISVVANSSDLNQNYNWPSASVGSTSMDLTNRRWKTHESKTLPCCWHVLLIY